MEDTVTTKPTEDKTPIDDKGMLWKTIKYVVEQLDAPGIEEKIAGLRNDNPGIKNKALTGILIREKALRSGLIGGLTALPSNIPILGTIATLTIGTAVDLGTLLRYQCILIIEVGAVYGTINGSFQSMIDILSILSVVSGDRRSRQELDRIRLSSVGDRCFSVGSKQLLNKIATRIGIKLVQKSSAKTIPVLGALFGAGINYNAIDDVGRTAERYFHQSKRPGSKKPGTRRRMRRPGK